jgi:outer membrane protein assembly factor BamE (lipoprotein component of BamABCDE complex)
MRLLAISALALFVAAPTLAREKNVKDDPNTLTHGMVQMTLKVGETSQGQILETFGAPNITSIDGSGQEMWVYDRHATVSSNSSSGFSIGMLVGAGGGDVGGGAGLGFGKKKSKSSQSSRTMTLIIKFNDAKIVSDFRSRSSSF